MKPARLAIVVVNFRTPDLTIDCLRSLAPEVAAQPAGELRVVIVDNGSGDDSATRISAAIADNRWQAWAELVTRPDNGGFAAGNNHGIRHCPDAAHYLLLNSDTLVQPGTLAHCLAAVAADDRIGAYSCRLANPDGSAQNVARRFPTPARLLAGALGLPWSWPAAFAWADVEDPGWDRDREARDVEWLGGAFLLVRGDLLRRFGGLDDDFFFYGEDIAFCHRLMRAGYRRHYDPSVSITHLGGGSSDPTRLSSRLRNVHAWRGRYLVQRKCYGRLAAWLVRASDIVAYGVRVAGRALAGRGRDPRSADLRAVFGLLIRPLRARA